MTDSQYKSVYLFVSLVFYSETIIYYKSLAKLSI